MESTAINGTGISQMSSIFIPIRENCQVEPRKQQQLLSAPSTSGTKRKLAQMKYCDNDIMYQMHRDKRLRFDQQQNNISSLSIGVQKSSGNSFNGEQHRQSYSPAMIPAAGAADLFSPSTAAIFHSVTAETAGEFIGRVINTNNVLLNAICNSFTPAASTNISLKKSNSENDMSVLSDHAAHNRWMMPPPPPKCNADDDSKQQGISSEFKTIGDYKERKIGNNISSNETDEESFRIIPDAGYDEDGKGWTAEHLRHILSSYHLKPPLSPICDDNDQQYHDVAAVSSFTAATSASIRIVPKQQQQFKKPTLPSNTSPSDLLSSIMNDQKKMLVTNKHQQNPSLPAPRPVASVVGVQFSVSFIGEKAKWIEQQRRKEQERRCQLRQQVHKIHPSPAVVSLMREIDDGFNSMSPPERRQYIADKFIRNLGKNATDDKVIDGNDNSEWD